MSLPALVLIHGYPFDHTMWDHVAALLSPDAPVLAPDLPGFGSNPVYPGEPSLDLLGDHVRDLLVQKDVARAVVAGMSMGGYVALSFAQHHKGRLAGLALISSQAAADSEDMRTGRMAMIEKVRREGPSAASQAAIPKLFAPENTSKPEFARFPILGAEKAGVEGITWALQAMARRPDRTEVVRSLQVPLLILHGAKDQFIPASCARELARVNPRAEYVELPDAGHATPLEAAPQVAQALRALLQRCAV